MLEQQARTHRERAGTALYDLAETLLWIHRSDVWKRFSKSWVEFLRERKLPGASTCAKLFTIVQN